MVFVTVGTHEQPFDRLMYEVERLNATGEIRDVVVQYGYSTVCPTGCRCEQFLTYEEMRHLFSMADVVICHGGPSTFYEAISSGKVPIVVPRRACFGEHVNDHQVAFCHQFAERVGGIEVLDDISDLSKAIACVRSETVLDMKSNNVSFCIKLSGLINDILIKK